MKLRLERNQGEGGGGAEEMQQIQEQFKALTNLLKNERRMQERRRRRSWAVFELQEAERRQDHAVVHRVVRVAGRQGQGPKEESVQGTPPFSAPLQRSGGRC